MSEDTAPPAEARPRPRKGPPKWGVVLFLALLAGFVIINQLVRTSGPPVDWIENDLEQAQALAAEREQRVFVYLYEPDDPTHRRNEQEVFTKYWARHPLDGAVCCRVDLSEKRLLAVRYEYGQSPLMLVLEPNGRVLTKIDGVIEELQFRTHIAPFLLTE